MAQQQTPVTSARPRVALWDHARFALIVLVVIGHLLTTLRADSELAYAFYVFIFLFHMPAMIFLSGLFSKPELTPKAITATWQLVVIWITWEGIWALIRLFTGGSAITKNWLIVPSWTLWFLVSLATMRILLPYIARLRHPLVFSVIVALAAGFAPAIGAHFSASRTLCFLPFFVAGWLAKERGWFKRDWFHRPRRSVQLGGLAVLATVALVLSLIPNFRASWRIDKWLTWRDGYETLLTSAAPLGADFGDFAQPTGVMIRLGLLMIAMILTIAIIAAVPRGSGRLTVWGSRTLYVYLLHGPIVMTLRATGVIEWIGEFGAGGIALLIVMGVAISALLSTTWVMRIFKPIIEPGFGWLMRRGT